MPKDYWCNGCKEVGCADCFLLGSDHDHHIISKSNDTYKTLLNEYTKDVKCYQDQMVYWVRYRDHLTRQLSDFKIDCLEKRDNEEEIFNSLLQTDQLMEENTNYYYEYCLKKVQAKIDLYTKALESGETYLNSLSVAAVLQNHEKYFSHAHSLVKEICDDAQKNYEEKSLGDAATVLTSIKHQCIIPDYDSSSFIITDFNRFRLGSDISNLISLNALEISSVTRFSGSLWRLKAYIFQSKKTDSLYLSLFVELFQGLPGEFEYKFQLKEPSHEFSSSLTKTYKSHFKEGECWGYQKFIKLDNLFNSLYYDDLNDSISLVYSIRPTTFYQKCINLQSYIVEMEHKIMNSSENNAIGINENHAESDVARLLEAIPIRSRESEITLTDEPSILLHQLEEIKLVENNELEIASPSSSVYESSTEAANTIFSRLLSTKLEKNPSVSGSNEE